MKKNVLKIITLLSVVILIQAVVFNTMVSAKADVESLVGQIDDTSMDQSGSNAIKNIVSGTLDSLRVAGAAIAIIILLVIACKYIMASAGDRADIKKYAINYIIGAMIFFGASGILTLIKGFIDDSINGSSAGE